MRIFVLALFAICAYAQVAAPAAETPVHHAAETPVHNAAAPPPPPPPPVTPTHTDATHATAPAAPTHVDATHATAPAAPAHADATHATAPAAPATPAHADAPATPASNEASRLTVTALLPGSDCCVSSTCAAGSPPCPAAAATASCCSLDVCPSSVPKCAPTALVPAVIAGQPVTTAWTATTTSSGLVCCADSACANSGLPKCTPNGVTGPLLGAPTCCTTGCETSTLPKCTPNGVVGPRFSGCCSQSPCLQDQPLCPSSSGRGPLGKLNLAATATCCSSFDNNCAAGLPICDVYMSKPLRTAPSGYVMTTVQVQSSCGCISLPVCACRKEYTQPEIVDAPCPCSGTPTCACSAQPQVQMALTPVIDSCACSGQPSCNCAPVVSNCCQPNDPCYPARPMCAVKQQLVATDSCGCRQLVEAEVLVPSQCPCMTQAVVAPVIATTTSSSCCSVEPCYSAPPCGGNVAVYQGNIVRQDVISNVYGKMKVPSLSNKLMKLIKRI